jgi:hypothetical protein
MLTLSTSIPRPKISVATRIRFSKALNAEYRAMLGRAGQVSDPKITQGLSIPFLLGKTRVDTDRRKIARHKELVQFDSSSDGFHENNDLFDGA